MDRIRAWAFLRFGISFAALYALWVVFTASVDAFSLIAGALGSALIAALTYRVFIAEHEASLRSFVPRPLRLVWYLLALIGSMYASSAQVLAATLAGRSSPRVVHFRTRLGSDLGRMILANSITFTPGTITLDLNDDHLTVHWFLATTRHSRAAGEAIKGQFEGRLKRALS